MQKLNTEEIKKILTNIYNVSKIDKFESIPNATVNKLFFFEINKKKYVLKILVRKPTSENEYYRFEKEAAVLKNFSKLNKIQEHTREQKIDVPVPEIEYIENSEEKIGCKFIIMQFVEGISLNKIWDELKKTEKRELVIRFAKIVKSIHSIKYEMFGQIEEYNCPRKFYSYENMLISNTRRYCRLLGVKEILPIKLIAKSLEFIEKNVKKIEFRTEPTLVHNDLNLSNIIVKKNPQNKWEIKAILDFEWSFAGNPLSDLFMIQEEILVEKDLEEAFFSEYFENKNVNIQNLQIEKKINKIISLLETVAIGWIHFHPTKENILYVKNSLEKILC